MKKRSVFIFLVLLAASINFYCSTAESFITDKSIPVGGQADFTLKTDKNGGYEWQLKQNSDPKVLGFDSKNYEVNASGQGTETFKFKGLKKGTVELIFIYVNKNTASTVYKTQTYSVIVR
jgi:predicted secreted protein